MPVCSAANPVRLRVSGWHFLNPQDQLGLLVFDVDQPGRRSRVQAGSGLAGGLYVCVGSG